VSLGLSIAVEQAAELAQRGLALPAVLGTALKSTAYAVALLGASLALTPLGVAGRLYAALALALGLGLVWYGGRWAMRPEPARARRLFLATLAYLPLLLAGMAIGRAAG
jgi:heme O synthase-like polyprenyltransferase